MASVRGRGSHGPLLAGPGTYAPLTLPRPQGQMEAKERAGGRGGRELGLLSPAQPPEGGTRGLTFTYWGPTACPAVKCTCTNSAPETTRENGQALPGT